MKAPKTFVLIGFLVSFLVVSTLVLAARRGENEHAAFSKANRFDDMCRTFRLEIIDRVDTLEHAMRDPARSTSVRIDARALAGLPATPIYACTTDDGVVARNIHTLRECYTEDHDDPTCVAAAARAIVDNFAAKL